MSHHDDIRTDRQRSGRLGFPEIVYGEFKSADQIARIVGAHERDGAPLLITRLAAEKVPSDAPTGAYDPIARTFSIPVGAPVGAPSGATGSWVAGVAPEGAPTGATPPTVAIISAGSSDRPVVAETLNTLTFLGVRSTCFQDVGVAGLNRLLNCIEEIGTHDVLIVIAGFEGALPSVVAGLLPQPVIAVPTSVGYGVASGGHSALHAMLASCANGVLVTNIDNGCGAAIAARRLLGRLVQRG